MTLIRRFLMVEDNEVDARLLERQLERSPLVDYALHRATCMSDALTQLDQNALDVILLDLNLPDSAGGLSTFRQMRAAAGQIPIIVITALENEAIAIQALREGAQEYLVKEDTQPSVLARVIRYSMERAAHVKTQRRLSEVQSQFAAAREIQQSLFPKQAPELPGYDVAGWCIPADETGGDYFDFIQFPDGDLGLVVGDVSGHGMGASLVMTETRSVLRTLASLYTDINYILTHTNAILSADIPEHVFITLLFARLDISDSILTFTGAGQEGVIINNGSVRCHLRSGSLPINIDASYFYAESSSVELISNDIVVMFTDGITETRADEDLFGIEGIVEAVNVHQDGTARQILNHLLDEAHDFSTAESQADDMTAIVIKCL